MPQDACFVQNLVHRLERRKRRREARCAVRHAHVASPAKTGAIGLAAGGEEEGRVGGALCSAAQQVAQPVGKGAIGLALASVAYFAWFVVHMVRIASHKAVIACDSHIFVIENMVPVSVVSHDPMWIRPATCFDSATMQRDD